MRTALKKITALQCWCNEWSSVNCSRSETLLTERHNRIGGNVIFICLYSPNQQNMLLALAHLPETKNKQVKNKQVGHSTCYMTTISLLGFRHWRMWEWTTNREVHTAVLFNIVCLENYICLAQHSSQRLHWMPDRVWQLQFLDHPMQ